MPIYQKQRRLLFYCNTKALIEIFDLDKKDKENNPDNVIFEEIGKYSAEKTYGTMNILQFAILQATRKSTVDATILEKMANIVKKYKKTMVANIIK